MKIVKFRKKLVNLVLSGEKTATRRLFDDKDLSKWDKISFVIKETLEEFAKWEIISTKEIALKDLTEKDRIWHEKFNSEKEMYDTYAIYYKKNITPEDIVKIIYFEIYK
jgi:hypothetical protein